MEIYTATQIIKKHKEWFHDQKNLPKLDEDKVSEAYELLQNLLNTAKNNEVLGNVVICRGCGSKDNYKCKITDVIVCKECGYQD